MRTLPIAGVVLAVLRVVPLHGQCADGTPPPCDVSIRPVVASRIPSEAERGRSFLVLPFRNVTRAPDAEWLIEGSPTLLADALGQWDEISVVPPERLYPALRRHGLEPGNVMDEDLVRRVAEETGGWTAVTGDVLATGGGIRVSARAYDVATKRIVVRAAEEVDADGDIRDAYERLAGRLLHTAGLEADAPDLPAATTHSLDAYRSYVEGLAHYYRGQVKQAAEHLTRAVTLDSTFAQAYARLAESSVSNLEALLDPRSPTYRHAERAAALAGRLPPRERERVQATAMLFRGQISEARRAFERMLAADSNDVEALNKLADLGLIDPILETVDGIERPRASHNEAARFSKRVLGLAPHRLQAYANLVYVYARAGGHLLGRVPGLREEQPSFPALLARMARPDATFVTVLRDSIELIPADSIDVMDPDTLAASRARAIATAVSWLERWLAAAPDVAEPHRVAAEVYTLSGRYDEALREIEIADSIGIEMDFESPAGRRLIILAEARRFGEAVRLADSLAESGYLNLETLGPGYGIVHFAWAFNVWLSHRRFAKADSLLGVLVGLLARSRPGIDSGRVVPGALCVAVCRTTAASPVSLPPVAEHVRFAMADSVLSGLPWSADGELLVQLLPQVVTMALLGARDSVRTAFGRRAGDAAAAMAALGRDDLVAKLVPLATSLDTTTTWRTRQFAVLDRALEHAPDEPDLRYQFGRLAALTGERLDAGANHLRWYLAQPERGWRSPSYAHAHFRLGMIYEHRDEVDRARAEYEAAVALDPDMPGARRALDRLNAGGEPPG